MNCPNCFYCEWFEKEGQGFCHRYPPKIIEMVIMYPVVNANDWCGEIVQTSKELH